VKSIGLTVAVIVLALAGFVALIRTFSERRDDCL